MAGPKIAGRIFEAEETQPEEQTAKRIKVRARKSRGHGHIRKSGSDERCDRSRGGGPRRK